MIAHNTLGQLLDRGWVAARLAEAALSDRRGGEVCAQITACARALQALRIADAAAANAFVVPGRIEVLGKHTDYAGGRSLLAAAERGLVFTAVARPDDQIRIINLSTQDTLTFSLAAESEPSEGWANYPMTVARRMVRNFPALRTGADISMTSDLPVAAGLSSSSALMAGIFLAIAAVNDLMQQAQYEQVIGTREDLAGYLAAVENGSDFRTLEGDAGVGTQGGSEDQTAMLCARPGILVQYAFAPIRFERAVPLPAGHEFVIAVSGVRAEKTGAAREAYNEAAARARVAAEIWRAETGRAERTLGAILASAPDAADRLRVALRRATSARSAPDALVTRLDHFVAEHVEIIPAAGDALERADLPAFGACVDRSQTAAERLLGNQIEETIQLARLARAGGAVAASAFGAGFGGSVWALVERGEADAFQQRWQAEYLARFPEHTGRAQFFRTAAGPPIIQIL